VPALIVLAIALMIVGAISALLIYDRHLLRRRVALLVHWIDASLAGSGHVTGLKQRSSRDLVAPLRLRSILFRNAKLHIRFAPHPLVDSLLQPFRKKPEITVNFLADLESMPRFAMEMQTMRWFARSRSNLNTASHGWTFETSLPLLLTTKLDWQREITAAFQALLASNHRDGVKLTFQPRSPNFRASFHMEECELESDPKHGVLQALMSVAEGASEKAS
jgi:hypothetical protein